MNDKITALVTGASSGIGYAISRMLVKRGILVLGIGRDFSKCQLESPLFLPLSIDLIDTVSLAKRIKELQQEYPISILINNAGTAYFGLHEELNSKKIHEMVTVNLEVPLLLTQMLLRDLKKHSGFIINISSITAKKSNPHGCAYGATKAGLTSFGSSLFDEARKYGVKVVTLHPDMTKSELYRNADFCQAESKETYLDPEEVAAAVEMVLSQQSGTVITDITLQPKRHQIQRK